MRGLFGKYTIKKSNGEPIDPCAKYFVLRYDKKSKDKDARRVLLEYAERSGNAKLKHDILAECEKEEA